MSFSPIIFFFPKTFFILKKATGPDNARFFLDSCLQTGQDLSTQIFKTRYLASVNFQFQDFFFLLSENFLPALNSVHIYTLSFSETAKLQHDLEF